MVRWLRSNKDSFPSLINGKKLDDTYQPSVSCLLGGDFVQNIDSTIVPLYALSGRAGSLAISHSSLDMTNSFVCWTYDDGLIYVSFINPQPIIVTNSPGLGYVTSRLIRMGVCVDLFDNWKII